MKDWNFHDGQLDRSAELRRSRGRVLVVPADKHGHDSHSACAAFTVCFKDHDIQTHHSLSDAVGDLHVLSGDQLREALQALYQPELPAELRAEEEGEELENSRGVCGCEEEEQT